MVALLWVDDAQLNPKERDSESLSSTERNGFEDAGSTPFPRSAGTDSIGIPFSDSKLSISVPHGRQKLFRAIQIFSGHNEEQNDEEAEEAVLFVAVGVVELVEGV